MDWTNEEILKNVYEIENDMLILSQFDLDEKYKLFLEKFPKLYETVLLNDPVNKKHLIDMLNIRTNMKNGTVGNISGNIQAGEYLSNKYLYPITGVPTLEQKKIAYRKIIKKDIENKNIQ